MYIKDYDAFKILIKKKISHKHAFCPSMVVVVNLLSVIIFSGSHGPILIKLGKVYKHVNLMVMKLSFVHKKNYAHLKGETLL